MQTPSNTFLISGAALSAFAALLHIGCMIFGAPWFRFLGAGDRIVRMAERGHWYPTVVAAVIAMVLFTWSAYALSGAGVVRRLPLLKLGLCAITVVYIARGIGFAAIKPMFPGNSATFWVVSSGISLAFGLVHLVGVRQVWTRL